LIIKKKYGSQVCELLEGLKKIICEVEFLSLGIELQDFVLKICTKWSCRQL